jgi:Icc-related predicted phosphoesterase
MKIMALTDIHGKLKYAPPLADELRSADLVLLPGDLTMFGRRPEAMEVVETVRNINPKVLAVMGNCDYPEVQQYLEEQGLFIHAGHRIVGGVAFAGLGGSLPCPVPTLNEWPEEQIERLLEDSVRDVPEGTPVVMVSHQPAKGTAVDVAGNGQHVGSEAVRTFIEKQQPLVCFSGHIHEAIGEDRIGDTRLINPGPFFTGAYAVCELNDGVVERLEICGVA